MNVAAFLHRHRVVALLSLLLLAPMLAASSHAPATGDMDTAAHAGYRVQVLEFNNRPGGRVWTLRGGDRYTELGGDTQDCGFAPGQYINPGPWRLPHHHHGILAYCRRLGVALER